MTSLKDINKIDYINQFDVIKVKGHKISDLNANLFDLIYLSQIPKVTRYYFVRRFLWVLSKMFSANKLMDNIDHLLVPSEPDQQRSIGMFLPVTKFLKRAQYSLTPLSDTTKGLKVRIVINWIIKLPVLYYQALDAFKAAGQIDSNFNKVRLQFIVDTLVHSLLIEHFEHSIKETKSVLVDWDRQRFASLLLYAAKKKSVKTYTFIHGAIYTPSKFAPLVADYCFAWSESQSRYLQSLGIERDRLIVVGNPRFNSTLPDVSCIKQEYGIERARTILYASQNFPDLKTDVAIRNILSSLVDKPHWRLLVKRHPAERKEDIEKYKKKYPEAIFLDNEIEADESLALCDFVILVSSTISIDTLVKKKNILLYNPWQEPKGIAKNLIEAGAVQFSTIEQLDELLNKVEKEGPSLALNEKDMQLFLYDYCSFTGTESAERIAMFLNNFEAESEPN